MDGHRFDTITKAWTRLPRRRLLGGLAGSALGAFAAPHGVREAGAALFPCRQVGRRCNDKSQCCSSRCKRGRCRAHHVQRCTAAKDICLTGTFRCGGGLCECDLTTGGAFFCSSGEGECVDCTTDAECDIALDTQGAACIAIFHAGCSCGNGSPTFCAKPCTK
jgi:hypothetical protein